MPTGPSHSASHPRSNDPVLQAIPPRMTPSAAGAPWYLADWGMLAVNPFSRQGRLIRRGETLDLGLRVVVHDGDAREADIATLYQAFRAQV